MGANLFPFVTTILSELYSIEDILALQDLMRAFGFVSYSILSQIKNLRQTKLVESAYKEIQRKNLELETNIIGLLILNELFQGTTPMGDKEIILETAYDKYHEYGLQQDKLDIAYDILTNLVNKLGHDTLKKIAFNSKQIAEGSVIEALNRLHSEGIMLYDPFLLLLKRQLRLFKLGKYKPEFFREGGPSFVDFLFGYVFVPNIVDTIYDELVQKKQNVLVYGSPGTGKTVITTKIVIDSIKNGHVVLLTDYSYSADIEWDKVRSILNDSIKDSNIFSNMLFIVENLHLAEHPSLVSLNNQLLLDPSFSVLLTSRIERIDQGRIWARALWTLDRSNLNILNLDENKVQRGQKMIQWFLEKSQEKVTSQVYLHSSIRNLSRNLGGNLLLIGLTLRHIAESNFPRSIDLDNILNEYYREYLLRVSDIQCKKATSCVKKLGRSLLILAMFNQMEIPCPEVLIEKIEGSGGSDVVKLLVNNGDLQEYYAQDWKYLTLAHPSLARGLFKYLYLHPHVLHIHSKEIYEILPNAWKTLFDEDLIEASRKVNAMNRLFIQLRPLLNELLKNPTNRKKQILEMTERILYEVGGEISKRGNAKEISLFIRLCQILEMPHIAKKLRREFEQRALEIAESITITEQPIEYQDIGSTLNLLHNIGGLKAVDSVLDYFEGSQGLISLKKIIETGNSSSIGWLLREFRVAGRKNLMEFLINVLSDMAKHQDRILNILARENKGWGIGWFIRQLVESGYIKLATEIGHVLENNIQLVDMYISSGSAADIASLLRAFSEYIHYPRLFEYIVTKLEGDEEKILELALNAGGYGLGWIIKILAENNYTNLAEKIIRSSEERISEIIRNSPALWIGRLLEGFYILDQKEYIDIILAEIRRDPTGKFESDRIGGVGKMYNALLEIGEYELLRELVDLNSNKILQASVDQPILELLPILKPIARVKKELAQEILNMLLQREDINKQLALVDLKVLFELLVISDVPQDVLLEYYKRIKQIKT